MTKLERWTHPQDYMGEEFPEYFIVTGQSRDSDYYTQSNFIVATQRLGGENPPKVIIARFGHWMVGWVEALMVHESAEKELEIAQEIRDELEEYPILDEDHYTELKQPEIDRIYEEITKDVERDLANGKTECKMWDIDLTLDKDELNERMLDVAYESVN